MASVVRKLIIIISTLILLQPAIKGQYIIYDDNIDENIDLPDSLESDSIASETFELEDNYLGFDLEKLESIFDGRQSRNLKKTKNSFCMAVPHNTYTYFGSHTVVYKPSVIKKYHCEPFDPRTYNPNVNGGICIIPGEHCTTKFRNKLFLKREKESLYWESESRNISVGCNCHYIANGL